MYFAYFYNVNTDEYYRSSSPHENKSGNGWIKIISETYFNHTAKEEQYAEAVKQLRDALYTSNAALILFYKNAPDEVKEVVETNRLLLKATGSIYGVKK